MNDIFSRLFSNNEFFFSQKTKKTPRTRLLRPVKMKERKSISIFLQFPSGFGRLNFNSAIKSGRGGTLICDALLGIID